jgi:hypothetical protein
VHNAISDIQKRRIAFNCTKYLHLFPLYQAFRALNFAERLAYSLEPDVRVFVQETLSRSSSEVFITEVKEHRPDVSNTYLQQMYESIVRTGEYAQSRTFPH